MSNIIDCLIIGYNEVDFAKHEKMIRSMGNNTGAYRDLSLDFINYKNVPYTVPGIFNYLIKDNKSSASDKENLSFTNTFSLTIAYLATYLHKRGLTFDYVNSFQYEKEQLIEKLKNNQILTIAIPTTLYVSPLPIMEVITFIKKYNNTAKIILGGPFVAAQMRSLDESAVQFMFMSLKADIYINSSQGEETLYKTIYAIKNDILFSQINNISYRDGLEYITNPTIIEQNSLEDNIVDWSLFADKLSSNVSVRTSISCPFSCSYCEYPQHSGKYQTASVETIEKELNALKSTGKVTSVGFIDDTFNVPLDRFKDLLRMMIKNNYNFMWNSFLRCQFVDEETVQLIKESGCQGVYLGIESGSDSILKNMNKSTTTDKYRRGMELLKKYGIISVASLLIGFPGETYETFMETVKFIEETEPDFITLHLWYCSKLTPIWQEREKYGINGSQFEWSHATMDFSTASDLIFEMHQTIKKSVYIPQYGFDFAGVVSLLNRGMSILDIKEFLTCFNAGVTMKIKDKTQQEISDELLERMRAKCRF